MNPLPGMFCTLSAFIGSGYLVATHHAPVLAMALLLSSIIIAGTIRGTL